MTTLDRWRAFLRTPLTLELPHSELIGRDHAPAVVSGRTSIHMRSANEFSYELRGLPSDLGYAQQEIARQRSDPYNHLAQFRLIGTDEKGTNWDGGYTTPNIEIKETEWTFSGQISSLTTDDTSSSVAKVASAELLFSMPPTHPVASHLKKLVSSGHSDGNASAIYVMETLGTKIHFEYDPSAETLFITAPTSEALPHPYAENWLGEPLVILFGQFVFPRLVSRNFGGNRSLVWVRRSPNPIYESRWTALWDGNKYPPNRAEFWTNYREILNLIANAQNFESHKITRLYYEIIQAARGTRWVWALTFSSTIEALTQMLQAEGQGPSGTEIAAAESLVADISKLSGDERLKSIAKNAIHRSVQVTTVRKLRALKATSVISDAQLAAWEEIRNAVMHGSLVSPYSTEEEDQKLLALATMVRALMSEVLRRSVKQKGQK